MKRKLVLLICMALLALTVQADIKLKKQGTATQLLVDGQPMMVLGGELSNSAATSLEDIDQVMPRMKALGLNTVFVPAYWEFIEPTEGKFDFALVDRVIEKARENDLKVIFLWFGAWKNSMSCYAPLWFKQDVKRFPRSVTETGKPLEIASAFSDNVLQADKKAFSALMRHVADTDRAEQTVIMVQVENEIGMLESARDYSPMAEKAWKSAVPTELLKALKIKKKGTWAEVFGTDLYAQEKFQAYYYAKYVEQLCLAAKEIYDIPLYVNAAMNSRGRKPGEYPSAGPLAHLMEIWKCAAPHIEIYAPDIYDTGFKDWVALYKRPDNPFFTPETQCSENSGVRALYAFGEVDALGFSPFAIDQASTAAAQEVTRAYAMVKNLQPLLLPRQGRGDTWGLLFDQADKERIITDGDVVMTCRHFFTLPWDPRATDGSAWPEGGAIVVRLAKHEYLIAGNGVVVTFQTATEKAQEGNVVRGEDGFVLQGEAANQSKTTGRFKGKRLGIGFVDQVSVEEDGTLRYIRRENGDQDHQGRHARISCGDYKILHVKLYEY